MSVLQIGSTGNEVRKLQRLLNSKLRNSPVLREDGVFGRRTYEAVIKFQSENKLKRDGIIGMQTWIALGQKRESFLILRNSDGLGLGHGQSNLSRNNYDSHEFSHTEEALGLGYGQRQTAKIKKLVNSVVAAAIGNFIGKNFYIAAKQKTNVLDKSLDKTETSNQSVYFSHSDADKVILSYGKNAVKMNATAEKLLKSILASCKIYGATLNSTLRTYYDQARITITQTYKKNPNTVREWYGEDVLNACKLYLHDINKFAAWWKERDTKRGKVSSKHLNNRAMDVVPASDRTIFVNKVKSLISINGSGVHRIIRKGELHEPVDHVEFTFDIT